MTNNQQQQKQQTTKQKIQHSESERERTNERTIKKRKKKSFINEGNGIRTIRFCTQPSGKQSKEKYKLKIKISY